MPYHIEDGSLAVDTALTQGMSAVKYGTIKRRNERIPEYCEKGTLDLDKIVYYYGTEAAADFFFLMNQKEWYQKEWYQKEW